MRSKTIVFAPLAFIALASLSFASVHVVEAADGPLAVRNAVDAAVLGDTILVRPGTYDAPDIDRSVTIVADGPLGSVVFENGTLIAFTGVDDVVVLRGLRLVGGTVFGSDHGLDIHTSRGIVWVEDCEIESLDSVGAPASAVEISSGLLPDARSTTVFLRTTIRASSLPSLLPAPADGVSVFNADVTFFDGVVESGRTTSGPAAALSALGNSEVFAAGTTFIGIDGVDEVPGSSCGTSGGNGVVASNSTVTFLDIDAVGGAPGVDSCGGAVAGLPLDVDPSATLSQFAGSARHFDASSVTVAGETVTLRFVGEPGDIVLLTAGTSPTALPTPEYKGVWLTGVPILSRFLGFLPASGELELDFALKPVGADAVQLYVQGLFVGALLEVIAAPGSAMTFLDAVP